MLRLLFFEPRTYIDWLNDNYWWPVILCVVIIALGFYFIYFYQPKIKESILSEEEIRAIINLFGGKDNIVSISKGGSRFKFELKNVEACNLEGIKELGCTGIFVSGSQVKLIFPFNADVLIDEVKS